MSRNLTEDELYEMTRGFLTGGLLEEAKKSTSSSDEQLLNDIATLIRKLKTSHPSQAVDMIERMISDHKGTVKESGHGESWIYDDEDDVLDPKPLMLRPRKK